MALPYLNHKQGKLWDFCFYPPIPSSSSHPTSFLSSLSPIDLTVVFTICQWCMPAGGHQIHYQVGQQFPHFYTQLYVEGGDVEKADIRDGAAKVCSL